MGITPKSPLYQGFIRRPPTGSSGAEGEVPFLASDGSTLIFDSGFLFDKAAGILTIPGRVTHTGNPNTYIAYFTNLTQFVNGGVGTAILSATAFTIGDGTADVDLIIDDTSSVPWFTADTGLKKLTLAGEIEIDGAFDHDGLTFGALGQTPATVRGAYTLTYSDETRTHDAVSVQALTNSTTGTAVTTLLRCDTGATIAVNKDNVNNNFATLVKEMNAIAADVLNLKKLVNSGIQDDKDFGFNTVA